MQLRLVALKLSVAASVLSHTRKHWVYCSVYEHFEGSVGRRLPVEERPCGPPVGSPYKFACCSARTADGLSLA